jgi:hypothetical protein
MRSRCRGDDSSRWLLIHLEVRDATDFPDVFGWATDGLIDAMATSHGYAGLWHYERVAPDFIVFRMLRPV